LPLIPEPGYFWRTAPDRPARRQKVTGGGREFSPWSGFRVRRSAIERQRRGVYGPSLGPAHWMDARVPWRSWRQGDGLGDSAVLRRCRNGICASHLHVLAQPPGASGKDHIARTSRELAFGGNIGGKKVRVARDGLDAGPFVHGGHTRAEASNPSTHG